MVFRDNILFGGSFMLVVKRGDGYGVFGVGSWSWRGLSLGLDAVPFFSVQELFKLIFDR